MSFFLFASECVTGALVLCLQDRKPLLGGFSSDQKPFALNVLLKDSIEMDFEMEGFKCLFVKKTKKYPSQTHTENSPTPKLST